MYTREKTPLALGGQQAWQRPVSPVQSTVQCECIQQQLHAALTLPICRLKRERERVGKDKGIRGFSVSSRATCCLLGVHCRCQQPVHMPLLLKYSCYGLATSLIWMQQSLGVTRSLATVFVKVLHIKVLASLVLRCSINTCACMKLWCVKPLVN